ncbi:MAG: hypothetical protein ACLRMJ_06300 [Alistipes finegoldii]
MGVLSRQGQYRGRQCPESPAARLGNRVAQSGFEDGRAYITVVEADAKTASAVNSWGYNDGHAYLKGLYTGDYWLQKIPVKYLVSGTKINCTGSIGGSGSSAGSS